MISAPAASDDLKVLQWDGASLANKHTVIVVLGGQFGDEGKGKIMRLVLVGTHGRLKAKFCIRFNGGPNAGHTIVVFRDDPELFRGPEFKDATAHTRLKFATHQVPSGVIWGIPCVIGYNCVVDLVKLDKEIQEIAEKLGQPIEAIQRLITIAPQAHVITDELIQQDRANNAVGTTGSGIGPTYSAKALRTGLQIISLCHPHHWCEAVNKVTIPESMEPHRAPHNGDMTLGYIRVAEITGLAFTLGYGDTAVMEGAQGFWLDLNRGLYPHVTSSDCTIGAACSYGFLFENLKPVVVSKAYVTYVGSKVLEYGFDQDTLNTGRLELLRLIAEEYGVTTGRRRQVLLLNMNKELEMLNTNQPHDWIINKSDVLEDFHQSLQLAHSGKLATEHQNPKIRAYGLWLQDHPEVLELMPTKGYGLLMHGQEVYYDSWAEMKAAIMHFLRNNKLVRMPRVLFYDTPDSEVKFDKPFLI